MNLVFVFVLVVLLVAGVQAQVGARVGARVGAATEVRSVVVVVVVVATLPTSPFVFAFVVFGRAAFLVGNINALEESSTGTAFAFAVWFGGICVCASAASISLLCNKRKGPLRR